MVERGTHTLREILSQPVVWQETLASFPSQARGLVQFWQQSSPEQLLVTGCGSTYYLSLTAAPLLQALTGVPSQARPASELVFFPEWLFPSAQRILLVTISRSATFACACALFVTGCLLLIPRDRVKVVPLQSRSFQYEELAKTGDNVKGQIVGEYTLEVHHENAMARLTTS